MVKAIGTRIEIYCNKILKLMRMTTAESVMMIIMMIDLNQEILMVDMKLDLNQEILMVDMKLEMNNTFKKLNFLKNNFLDKKHKFKLMQINY